MVKKAIFILTLCLVLAMGAIFVQSQSQKSLKDDTKTEILDIEKKFGPMIYLSFYSLEEIRPYAIIQLDKTIEMYENNWIKPSAVVSKLSAKEKDMVKGKIIAFIMSKNDEEKKELVNKLRFWCMANSQMEFLQKTLNQSQNQTLLACNRIPSVGEAFAEYGKTGPIDMQKLDDNAKDELFNKILNNVADMSFPDQMKFYSAVYAKLSDFAAAK